MSAEELKTMCEKLIKAASAVEVGKVDRLERAVDLIKLLKKTPVTMKLLMETDAAKTLKRLSKHSNTQIATGVSGLIKNWKATVTAEASKQEAQEEKKPKLEIEVKDEDKSKADEEVVKSPTTPAAKPNTGDPQRDKLAVSLCEALAVVLGEVGEDADGLAEPSLVGISIEAAMFRKFGGMTKEYKAKYRSISFNLKDSRNPDLRRKVLSGDISPYTLLTLSSEELGSDSKREANEAIRQHMMRECERGQTTQSSTDQFKCGKCGQRKTIYYQMQTRSADEPMTTFVTCVNCNNRW
eukprot:CAMPEP_0118933528 /NCGR_PEP_ID=MMETSP1169-20130426/12038_1 /TAXON_ID=36882 /ORGANISM="Pyramimonas obovata, Strain CCMP722" /LENGTH=295 /DNA_ID=CAMNT_0006876299 /DNA_START=64 /DNA_END=948 /DNA_ORIENTATION=-